MTRSGEGRIERDCSSLDFKKVFLPTSLDILVERGKLDV